MPTSPPLGHLPKSVPANATCPECGATLPDGMTCWDVCGNVLAWEWKDPALQAAHFLTVACYNLQHPAQFTDAAIAGLRVALAHYLDGTWNAHEIRWRNASVYDGRQRVRKPESERSPVLRQWSQTVADVYAHDQPAGAASRVRAWAAATRHDLGL
jgi:hypothetical protein